MEVMQIVWLALVIVFVIAEGATAMLVSVWFCAGALVSLLISLVWPEQIVAQCAAFLVVSTLALLALRPVVRKMMHGRRVPTNADANIGKVCQVVEIVQPALFGRVKLEGLVWTAKSDFVLPVGAWCVVQAIEGVKLVVVPLPDRQNS